MLSFVDASFPVQSLTTVDAFGRKARPEPDEVSRMRFRHKRQIDRTAFPPELNHADTILAVRRHDKQLSN